MADKAEQTKMWTGVSYHWVYSETRSSSFSAPADPEAAAIKFQKLYPSENLLALIPGEHTELRTYKLCVGRDTR